MLPNLDGIASESLPNATAAELPHLWRRSVLRVTCAAPSGLQEGPWLGAALRGAWGRSLARHAMDGAASQAFRAFFSVLPDVSAGRALPAPSAIAFERRGDIVVMELTLFGVADAWRHEAFDSFLAALAGGVAIAIERPAFRRPWTVLDAQWTRTESVAVPVPNEFARLIFRTPVRLGLRRSVGWHWPGMIAALADRAARMARWQGLHVDPEPLYWRSVGEKLIFRDSMMRPAAPWVRRSGAQGGRQIAMMGVEGALDIVRPPEALMPLLALGETMHVGSHTALGLGRYELLG
jgi:hypothetical protein